MVRSSSNIKTKQRAQWPRSIEFVLTGVGFAVGLGNIWRFPYLCYKSGGGAFLIPYFIMLFICSIPLVFLEMAVGQYTKLGPVGAMYKICPIFKGVGIAACTISFLWESYFNVIISWCIFYLIMSFFSPLPWIDCNHKWNSDHCWDGLNTSFKTYLKSNSTNLSVVQPNGTITPSQDFYERFILDKSDGLENMGDIRWPLALILLFAWILVFICIFKGPKSSGKVVYFSVTFPYVILIILLVRGVTLEGSLNGVLFFITPKWHRLLDAQVWLFAAQQSFNSTAIGFLGILAMASYNKFDNNIHRDALIIPICNALTSVFGGFVIFSILGHVALKQGTEIDQVVSQGPGLVFIVYPAGLALMPASNVFAVLFFFTCLMLGIDSQFVTVEVVATVIFDSFSDIVERYLRRKEIAIAIICCVSYLAGLPNITQGGVYFFQVIDYYAAGTSLIYVAFFEVVSIVWIYGGRTLADNIEEMTGKRPHAYYLVCWYCFSPLLMVGILVFSIVTFKPLTMDNYTLPSWSITFGNLLLFIPISCIPLCFIHEIIVTKAPSLWQKIKIGARTRLNPATIPSDPSVSENTEQLLKTIIHDGTNAPA